MSSIFISLTDITRLTKKNRILISSGGIFFALTTFLYLILKPISFTTSGIFNGNISHASTPLVKALEFFGKEEHTLSSADQCFLLSSPPVLAGVVQALNLQASLTEKQKFITLREIWYNLKTIKAFWSLKKQKVPSNILSGDIYTPVHLIIPDIKQSVICNSVTFSSETALSLKIIFSDVKNFCVYKGKKKLGYGSIDIPFIFSEGSFSLSGNGKKGKLLGLHLIPLNTAVNSLKKTLRVTKNKENSSLIDISYTHRNRHFAAQIVNEVMEQIQVYLMSEGKKKIKKQLLYLELRQNEIMEQLEDTLCKQKSNFESDLNSDTILTLEKELDHILEQRAQKKEELQQLQSEIEYLSQIIQFSDPNKITPSISISNPVSIPLSDRVFCLSPENTYPYEKNSYNVHSTLSIDAARNLISQHQQQLDTIYLTREKYAYCLSKLVENEFDSSSLAHILNNEPLSSHFEKMQNLHHQLIDEKSWNCKERGLLKRELEIEKQFLTQYIYRLKDGTAIHEKILKDRILSLQHDLLSLLSERYHQVEEILKDLKKQASYFPQKWLNDQKIEIHTKLYTDMIESITKMVEAKNIGYNIDYFMPGSFQKAVASVLPNDPRLLRGILLGGLTGILITFLCIFMYQLWIGPSASLENLLAQGRIVISKSECIQRLGLTISKGEKLVLLISQEKSLLILPLINWLTKRGEKVFLIDLTTNQFPEFMESGEAFLASKHFQELLQSFKENYDRIIIISKSAPKTVENQILCSYADTIVINVTRENLLECCSLPVQTIFFIQENKDNMLSLNAITPLLAKLLKDVKNSSFSSVKYVLKWFPSKSI